LSFIVVKCFNSEFPILYPIHPKKPQGVCFPFQSQFVFAPKYHLSVGCGVMAILYVPSNVIFVSRVSFAGTLYSIPFSFVHCSSVRVFMYSSRLNSFLMFGFAFSFSLLLFPFVPFMLVMVTAGVAKNSMSTYPSLASVILLLFGAFMLQGVSAGFPSRSVVCMSLM